VEAEEKESEEKEAYEAHEISTSVPLRASPLRASLFIDDNNNSTSQTNHFGANTVTLNGGTLYFRLDGNGTYGGTVVANLKLTGGGFIGASGQNGSLDDQIAALTSVTTTSTATVTFGSFYLNLGNSNEVVIGSLNGASVTTSSNTNNIIGGWATATNNSSGTTPPDGNTDFASFSTTVAGEVVQLGQTNAPAYDATAIASHTSTQNINETSTETLSTPVAVNALAYNGGGITDNTALTLTSGGLIIGGTNRTLAGTGTLTAGSGGSFNLYTTVNDPNTYSIAAQITDNSSNPVMFVKAGVGSLSLSNTNTYTGGTQINGGTLRANSSTTSLGTGAVSVNAGGTLGGGGTVGNTGGTLLTVNSGGTIAAGPDAVTTGTLTSGSQVWDAGAGYAWKIASLSPSPTSTTNAARGSGGSGTAGTSSSWDDVAMSALTLSSLGGSNPSFTVRVSDTSTLAPTAYGTYSWIIAQSTAAVSAPSGYNVYVNGTTTNSNLLAAGSSGGNAAFALDTSAFSVSGGTSLASAFTLELVSNGASGDNLVLDYNAAPEPCTGILFLAGAGPLLMARRRRTSMRPSAQNS
jgi:fibronectin-binding autotransporter adhesin